MFFIMRSPARGEEEYNEGTFGLYDEIIIITFASRQSETAVGFPALVEHFVAMRGSPGCVK